jgi:hypothetical protein
MPVVSLFNIPSGSLNRETYDSFIPGNDVVQDLWVRLCCSWIVCRSIIDIDQSVCAGCWLC